MAKEGMPSLWPNIAKRLVVGDEGELFSVQILVKCFDPINQEKSFLLYLHELSLAGG